MFNAKKRIFSMLGVAVMTVAVSLSAQAAPKKVVEPVITKDLRSLVSTLQTMDTNVITSLYTELQPIDWKNVNLVNANELIRCSPINAVQIEELLSQNCLKIDALNNALQGWHVLDRDNDIVTMDNFLSHNNVNAGEVIGASSDPTSRQAFIYYLGETE